MSAWALHLSMALPGPLDIKERALLCSLAYHALNNQNFCTAGREKLKDKSGLSDHFLTKTMASLVEKGLVTVGRRKNPKERWKNTSNTYTLVFIPKAKPKTVEEEGVDIWRIG